MFSVRAIAARTQPSIGGWSNIRHRRNDHMDYTSSRLRLTIFDLTRPSDFSSFRVDISLKTTTGQTITGRQHVV